QRGGGNGEEEGASGFGAWDYCRSCGAGYPRGVSEAKKGSHRAMDDASGSEAVSDVSRAGGMGNGEDGGVRGIGASATPGYGLSSANIASISDCACRLPVRRAEAMPSVSIFFASSCRSALASVCAAMK